MKSRPWESGESGGWVCADAQDAWSAMSNNRFPGVLFDACIKVVGGRRGNDKWLIAAGTLDPSFETLCRIPVEELEAVRLMAERLSPLWCLLTAAVLWHELPRDLHPDNSPPPNP